MSEQAVSYPADAGATTYLLTVRGKVAAPSVADVRELHNATAGAPQGVAAARSLGDLSHNVYSAVNDGSDTILFIDHWNSLSGLGRVLRRPAGPGGRRAAVRRARRGRVGPDERVRQPSSRAAVGPVGRRRRRPARRGQLARCGRGRVHRLRRGDDQHRAALRARVAQHVVADRRPGGDRGAGDPRRRPVDRRRADECVLELRLGYEHLGPVFAGEPQTSVWQSAKGEWIEW